MSLKSSPDLHELVMLVMDVVVGPLLCWSQPLYGAHLPMQKGVHRQEAFIMVGSPLDLPQT